MQKQIKMKNNMFKDAVKVLASSDCAESIRVGKIGKDSNFIAVFESSADGHF